MLFDLLTSVQEVPVVFLKSLWGSADFELCIIFLRLVSIGSEGGLFLFLFDDSLCLFLFLVIPLFSFMVEAVKGLGLGVSILDHSAFDRRFLRLHIPLFFHRRGFSSNEGVFFRDEGVIDWSGTAGVLLPELYLLVHLRGKCALLHLFLFSLLFNLC